MLSSRGAGLGELLEKLLQRTRKRYRLFISSGTMAKIVIV